MVDETGYLEELEDIAETGVTAAERLLDLYHGPWPSPSPSMGEGLGWGCFCRLRRKKRVRRRT
jgi:hypothetical protein